VTVADRGAGATATRSATLLRDGRTLTWERTTWEDPRGAALRAAMDAEIGPRYASLRGDAPPPGRPSGDDVACVLLALVTDADGEESAEAAVAATGTLRRLPDRWEVKRLFIDAGHRRLGLASALLARIEDVAREHGAQELFLQTGNRQPEAIALYERNGWERTEVYAPYDPADGISVCFRKGL
jgi:GNAT superfamily N-acetyltransferase